jgi:hypothetical protein
MDFSRLVDNIALTNDFRVDKTNPKFINFISLTISGTENKKNLLLNYPDSFRESAKKVFSEGKVDKKVLHASAAYAIEYTTPFYKECQDKFSNYKILSPEVIYKTIKDIQKEGKGKNFYSDFDIYDMENAMKHYGVKKDDLLNENVPVYKLGKFFVGCISHNAGYGYFLFSDRIPSPSVNTAKT